MFERKLRQIEAATADLARAMNARRIAAGVVLLEVVLGLQWDLAHSNSAHALCLTEVVGEEASPSSLAPENPPLSWHPTFVDAELVALRDEATMHYLHNLDALRGNDMLALLDRDLDLDPSTKTAFDPLVEALYEEPPIGREGWEFIEGARAEGELAEATIAVRSSWEPDQWAPEHRDPWGRDWWILERALRMDQVVWEGLEAVREKHDPAAFTERNRIRKVRRSAPLTPEVAVFEHGTTSEALTMLTTAPLVLAEDYDAQRGEWSDEHVVLDLDRSEQRFWDVVAKAAAVPLPRAVDVPPTRESIVVAARAFYARHKAWPEAVVHNDVAIAQRTPLPDRAPVEPAPVFTPIAVEPARLSRGRVPRFDLEREVRFQRTLRDAEKRDRAAIERRWRAAAARRNRPGYDPEVDRTLAQLERKWRGWTP